MDASIVSNEFRKSLKRFIRSKVSNKQDAEDILQEVFIKIYKNVATVHEDEKIQAWVYQIARNTIIDYYRKRDKDVTANPQLLQELIREQTIIDNNEEENKNVIVASWLKDMIESLPDKYREALVLTELQNATQKELTDTLQISISGAKSRVQWARSKLKDVLLECCHVEMDTSGNVIDYKKNDRSCSCD